MAPRKDRGAVLLLVLWATAALAAMEIAQATRVSLQLKWLGRLQESNQSWHAGWAAVELASSRLSADPQLSWDAPMEAWAQPLKTPLSFESGTFECRISDEQARIGLNAAALDLLERLPGFTSQAANALLERRGQGKRISHLGELSELPGFQQDSLEALEPLVTVYGPGGVNINAASAQVLTLLGLSPGFASGIVRYRAGPDGVEGTPDDRVFTDAEQIAPVLEGALGPLLAEDQIALGSLISSQRLEVRSSFFRVGVKGRTLRHGISREGIAILERASAGETKVRGWHED